MLSIFNPNIEHEFLSLIAWECGGIMFPVKNYKKLKCWNTVVDFKNIIFDS